MFTHLRNVAIIKASCRDVLATTLQAYFSTLWHKNATQNFGHACCTQAGAATTTTNSVQQWLKNNMNNLHMKRAQGGHKLAPQKKCLTPSPAICRVDNERGGHVNPSGAKSVTKMGCPKKQKKKTMKNRKKRVSNLQKVCAICGSTWRMRNVSSSLKVASII